MIVLAWRVLPGCVALTALLACTQQHPPAADTGGRAESVLPVTPGQSHADRPAPDTGRDPRARLARLERDARALARTDGCASSAQCRSAAVGWRSCGGPRTYIAYCVATTDTVALFRTLRELEKAEREYNAASGMMSTCEYRMPPSVRLDGGRCVAGAADVSVPQ